MTQGIIITNYCPGWATAFADLRTALARSLGDLALTIEHVGSTAVPDLAAKPIIDLDVVIESTAVFPQVARRLAVLGYEHLGDQGIAGREAFGRENATVPHDGTDRTWPEHHLYVCAKDSSELARHLAFRDFLRARPEEAAAYATLKRELAERHRHDREAYCAGKTEFVQAALGRAQNEKHLWVIHEILVAAESAGLRVWLLGGWGVEALLGRVTRAHEDIDLIAALESRPALRELVDAFADDVQEDTPQKLRFVKGGVRCDVCFFQALPDGTLALDLDADDPLVYPTPPDSFPMELNGRLPGVRCRAISWSAQYVAKAGFCYFRDEPLREKDEHDLQIIREHLSEQELADLVAYFPGVPAKLDKGECLA